MTVSHCCLCMTAQNPAWPSGASWTSLSRRPRRASAPGNASRIWTVGPQRPSPPTRIWTPCTRTASGNEGSGCTFGTFDRNDTVLITVWSLVQTFQPNISAAGRKKPVHQVLHHWDGWRNVHLGCQGMAWCLLVWNHVWCEQSWKYSTFFQTLESAMKNLKIVWAGDYITCTKNFHFRWYEENFCLINQSFTAPVIIRLFFVFFTS